jgi:hypothetical protein
MNSASAGGGLRQPVNPWGRSPADPTPQYVGEQSNNATTWSGVEANFGVSAQKFLMVHPE